MYHYKYNIIRYAIDVFVLCPIKLHIASNLIYTAGALTVPCLLDNNNNYTCHHLLQTKHTVSNAETNYKCLAIYMYEVNIIGYSHTGT